MREGMKPMTIYHVDVVREGKWWMIHIPELDGLTQARRLSETEKEAVDFIAVTLDAPRSSIEVEMHTCVEHVEDLDVRAAAAAAARQAARDAQDNANEIMAALAQDLASAEVPVRDIGKVLGVSFQRADQLAKMKVKARK